MKPNVIIFSGYGLNSEEETKFAFKVAGATTVDIVHINDLIDKRFDLKNYQIAAFPGGFAYGDDTGSGNAYANKLKNHLWNDIEKFVNRTTLIIGICNGFQIIVNLGLLPALKYKYGDKQVALLHNEKARYIDRWVDLKITNKSPWLKDIETFSTAISHGEGRLYASPDVLKKMKENNQSALKYIKGEICEFQNLDANPTGTLENIAGITNESGKILGLMPHPERGMLFTQRPDWTFLKEQYKREGKKIPEFTDGIKLFKNAINYFI
jgi:phosphoribosylformylglycinamidine synthase